jgi:hypothetical protein
MYFKHILPYLFPFSIPLQNSSASLFNSSFAYMNLVLNLIALRSLDSKRLPSNQRGKILLWKWKHASIQRNTICCQDLSDSVPSPLVLLSSCTVKTFPNLWDLVSDKFAMHIIISLLFFLVPNYKSIDCDLKQGSIIFYFGNLSRRTQPWDRQVSSVAMVMHTWGRKMAGSCNNHMASV